MGLNSGFDDDGDTLGMSTQVSEQASEQAREDASSGAKQQVQLKKDETKALQWDVLLSQILNSLLSDAKYDHLIANLLPLLQKRIPSHFLAPVLSLIHNDWIAQMRTMQGGESGDFADFPPLLEKSPYQEPLPEALQKNVNIWFEGLKWALIRDPSLISTDKFQKFFQKEDTSDMTDFLTHVFGHFLYTKNILISDKKARAYALFIMREVQFFIQSISSTK